MLPSQVIEKFGWVQGSMGNEEEGFCALGALEHVYYTPPHIEPKAPYLEYEEALMKLLEKRHGFTIGIPEWNDAPRRTKRQVINVLRRVEKELGLATK